MLTVMVEATKMIARTLSATIKFIQTKLGGTIALHCISRKAMGRWAGGGRIELNGGTSGWEQEGQFLEGWAR